MVAKMKGESGTNCMPPGNCHIIHSWICGGTDRDIIEWEPQSSYLMELSVSTIILKKEAL